MNSAWAQIFENVRFVFLFATVCIPLQLVDDATLSHQLFEALAEVQPETVPEAVADETEPNDVTEPKELNEPMERRTPPEPKTPPLEPEVTVKAEVTEEEEEEDQTAWWESQHEDDWYWEGVEEEDDEDDVAVVCSKPPQPPQPKSMPTNKKVDVPPPPPPMPCPPPPPARVEPPQKGSGKAPWAYDVRNDRVLRTDKHGGQVYKSGWYQDRWGKWWEILDFVLEVPVCLRFSWYVSFWYCFCFGLGCTLFERFGNFLQHSGRELGATVLASRALAHSRGASSTGRRSKRNGGKAWQKQSQELTMVQS